MAVRFTYRNAPLPRKEDAITLLSWSTQESMAPVGATWFLGYSDGRHGSGMGYREEPLYELANQIKEYIKDQHPKCEGRVLGMGAHATSTATNKSCMSIDLIQLDCDKGGVTMGQMIEHLKSIGCRAIIYPSPSESSAANDALRFRVLLQCVRFIPDPSDYEFQKAWADRFHAVRVCFESLVGAKLDPSTDRLAQLAYVHPVHAPREASDVVYLEGKIIDAQAVAEELRTRGIWLMADDISEPEDRTLDIDSNKHLIEILERNSYLLGPSDNRGWIPTKCPRACWHSSENAAVGSTAINSETGVWLCHHAHSRSPTGPVRGTPYHMIRWLSEDLPHEWAAGGLELSFAVRRVQARIRANAAAMSSPLPLARVQADVIQLTDEVCEDYRTGADGILGVHAGTVGGGKSHAVPEIVKIAQRKVQIAKDEKKENPIAIVSVRDRKAVKEAYVRLREAGLRVVQQQSIDSVRTPDNKHVCIYAQKALQLTSEGIDAREILCKGGLTGDPCPNSKIHGDAAKLCPAELGFTGEKDAEVVLCTHAGSPGVEKFLKEGTIVIQDEHESGALHHYALMETTLKMAQRRANHLRDKARSLALVGISQHLISKPNLLGTPADERDSLCYEILAEWTAEGHASAMTCWEEAAYNIHDDVIEWKKNTRDHQSSYMRKYQAWEKSGSRGAPPAYTSPPEKPVIVMTGKDAILAAIKIAKRGGRGNLSEYAEDRWRKTGDLPGGNGAGSALEALVKWIGGARSVNLTDREGKTLDGVWSIQWYGQSTKMVQEHVIDKKGPAIVLDATADEQWWVGASSKDRVKYRRTLVEDQAKVKRIVIATYQARLKYIINDDNTVKWSGMEHMISELCREMYKYNSKGGLSVAAIARRQVALTMHAFWNGLTAREIQTNPMMQTVADDAMLEAVSKSIKTMSKTAYGNLSQLRALYPNFKWTWYGSTISVGSNELSNCDVYLSLGDPLPPPEVAEANASVSGRTTVDSASWIACSLVEQWYGRARAVRRKDVPILMIHVGACVAQSWISAEIYGLEHGPATITPIHKEKTEAPDESIKPVGRKFRPKELPEAKELNKLDTKRLMMHVIHELGSPAAVTAEFSAACGKEYSVAAIRNWQNGTCDINEQNFVTMATLYVGLVKKPSRWAYLGAKIAGLTQGRSYRAIAAGIKSIAAFRGHESSWIDAKTITNCVGGTGLTDEQWGVLKLVLPEYERQHPGGCEPRELSTVRSAKTALEGQPMHLLMEVAKNVYGLEVASAYGVFKTLNEEHFDSGLMTPWVETDIICCDGFLVREGTVKEVAEAMAHQYAGEPIAPGLDKHNSMRFIDAMRRMGQIK